jgi:hypothetical protein
MDDIQMIRVHTFPSDTVFLERCWTDGRLTGLGIVQSCGCMSASKKLTPESSEIWPCRELRSVAGAEKLAPLFTSLGAFGIRGGCQLCEISLRSADKSNAFGIGVPQSRAPQNGCSDESHAVVQTKAASAALDGTHTM